MVRSWGKVLRWVTAAFLTVVLAAVLLTTETTGPVRTADSVTRPPLTASALGARAHSSGWGKVGGMPRRLPRPAGNAPAPGQLLPATTPTTSTSTAPSGFITRRGDQLLLSGQAHQFMGVDAYELGTDWGINAGCGGMLTDSGLDQFFASLPVHSLVRSWFYQPMATNVHTGGRDWRSLDRVVAAAARHGDYLIATLGDEGGVCDGANFHDLLWYQQGWQTAISNQDGQGLELTTYRQWVTDTVSRYRSSPAIGLWELINEPETSTCPLNLAAGNCGDPRICPSEQVAETALHGFFAAASAEIRSLDPYHLVSTGLGGSGVCGAQGSDYGPVQDVPGVDVFSYHDYGNDATALTPAIMAAIAAAHHAGKAIIAGETGIMAGDQPGCATWAARSAMLKAKRDAQFGAGANGFLVWNWVPDARRTPSPCSFDLTAGDPYLAP
jgi:mannan endo-1,4-beta-mannosidase